MVCQHKTGHVVVGRLGPETIRAIRATEPPAREFPLRWPGNARQMYKWFAKLRQIAGVEGGALQMIRRSSASYIARDFGTEAASRHLGHKSPDLARKHYIDPRIAWPADRQPLPPAIGGVE